MWSPRDPILCPLVVARAEAHEGPEARSQVRQGQPYSLSQTATHSSTNALFCLLIPKYYGLNIDIYKSRLLDVAVSSNKIISIDST